jgi:hypothetical protein
MGHENKTKRALQGLWLILFGLQTTKQQQPTALGCLCHDLSKK